MSLRSKHFYAKQGVLIWRRSLIFKINLNMFNTSLYKIKPGCHFKQLGFYFLKGICAMLFKVCTTL